MGSEMCIRDRHVACIGALRAMQRVADLGFVNLSTAVFESGSLPRPWSTRGLVRMLHSSSQTTRRRRSGHLCTTGRKSRLDEPTLSLGDVCQLGTAGLAVQGTVAFDLPLCGDSGGSLPAKCDLSHFRSRKGRFFDDDDSSVSPSHVIAHRHDLRQLQQAE